MRSLILAGGGIKVGYQAGCLEAFDRLKLTFDHVDASSGGCFNAAMMANGMSGKQIADQWRQMNPLDFIALDFQGYRKFIWARSVGTNRGLKKIFRDVWKLDFHVIQNYNASVITFNHFNFTDKRVFVVENKKLTEDLLLASVALLGWTPTVEEGSTRLFDAVWITDGNVSEAIRRGCDELWVIWTVSDRREIRDGLLATYFHLVETVANARFVEEWEEINIVNRAIKQYGPTTGHQGFDLRLRMGATSDGVLAPPPPGRKHIERYLIKQEVPVHYVLNFSRDRMAAAVELGVDDTIAFARKIGWIPSAQSWPSGAAFKPILKYTAPPVPEISFNETMRGYCTPAAPTYSIGASEGAAMQHVMIARLLIEIADLNSFLHRSDHVANIRGTIFWSSVDPEPMTVTSGTFQLFVNDRDKNGMLIPAHKKMLYHLEFGDTRGTTYRLSGEKLVTDGHGFTVWPDTTTLYVLVDAQMKASPFTPFAAGIIRVHPFDFLVELTTFRAPRATSFREGLRPLRRFAAFWTGQLCDVYARWCIDYAPL
jgi:predicted acylesterase/phospholipase RssA